MKLSKEKTIIGLGLAVVLQISVLAMEYGGAVYPLLTGQEITLKVIPVDPRSLFRGNYARLNYEINQVVLPHNSRELRENEFIYVKLKQNQEGDYIADSASLEKPEVGLYIRGRTHRTRGSDAVRVRYGIEAFFAPKEKALALERKLPSGAVAKIMLAKNGKATLKDVIAQ